MPLLFSRLIAVFCLCAQLKESALVNMKSSSQSNEEGSRSPSLDYARRTQVEAMERRTAKRVDELLAGGSAGRKEQTVTVSPSKARSARDSPLLDAVRQTHHEALAHRTAMRMEDLRKEGLASLSPPLYDEAVRLPSTSPSGSLNLVEQLSMKRNVTQRRSRGRVSDDGSTALKSSLLSRRPRSRSKDRRYSMENQAPDTQLFSQYETYEPVVSSEVELRPTAVQRRIDRHNTSSMDDVPSPHALMRHDQVAESTAWQENEMRRQALPAQQSFFSPRDREILVQPPLEGGVVLDLAGQASAVRRESNLFSSRDRESLSQPPLEGDLALGLAGQAGAIRRTVNLDAAKQSLSIPEMFVGSSHPNPSHSSKRMDSEVKRHETTHEVLLHSVRQDGLSMAPMPGDAFYEGFNVSEPFTMDSSMPASAPEYRSSFDKRPKADSEHLASDSGEESNAGGNGDGSNDGSNYGGSIVRHKDGQRGLFRKQFIPDRASFPELHDILSQMWDHRQSAFTAMNLSLNDDDMHHYDIYRALFASANLEMFSVLKDGLRRFSDGTADCERQDWRATSAYSHKKDGSNLVTPRAAPESIPMAETRGKDEGSMPLSESLPRRPITRGKDEGSMPLNESLPRRPIKQSYKETEYHFEISFSYQAVVTPRVVNGNLPTRILYSMARGYLENDFGFRLGSDYDLELTFEDRLISRLGVLDDVPLSQDSIIVVRYPIKPPISRESPGTPSTKSAHSRVDPRQSKQLSPARSPLEKDGDELYDAVAFQSIDPRSYDKIRQNFKCPKFSGQARDWKIWDKGFWRYLSIWELEYVLDPAFFDEIPLSPEKRRDNKLVYFIIEDAVQNSTLATSYIKQAPLGNGFEAYYVLHDGYVFAGSTTATLLLNELSHFRFLADETPTELCLRLDELFQELKDLPADASVSFNDTQKVGYLVNALRHEKEWDYVCSAITSAQIKGGYTFHEACSELKFRCEASRANDLLDKPVKGKRVKGLLSQSTVGGDQDNEAEQLAASVMGLISSMSKKLNVENGNDKKGRRARPVHPCLAAGCEEQTYFPLCPLHYHPLLSGKSTTVKLRNNYGDATYDSSSQSVRYPSKVPDSRLSAKQIADRKPGNQTSAKVVTIETPSTSVSAKIAGSKQ